MSFAIIGGGPAGFYLARFLAKMNCKPIVHVYEKDMCPFGLLRYGVAPDHISIKKAEINLSSVASYEHFDFIGNYPIDKSQIHSLSQSYSAVIYAIGAQGTN